jgi:starvation-inducible DNA-binding protein
MEKLIHAAKIAFSSTFSFYLKAHNFHWNVEGPDFYEYHKLLEQIYEEVYSSIDDFAEKIRSLGAYVPASYTKLNMLTEIEDQTSVLPKNQMVLVLLEDNRKMLKILKFVYDFAEANGEHGFSNFLAERMDAHRKHGWMLESSLKGQGNETP